MPTYDRSGHTSTTLRMGRWKCVRQEWMTAGEVIEPHLMGNLKLEALRESLGVDVRADIVTFYTPARFLWDEWIDYIKEGIDTEKVLPEHTLVSTGSGNTNGVSEAASGEYLGIGALNAGFDIMQMWLRNYNSIWNWYFRFPDDEEIDIDYQSEGRIDNLYGLKAVALEAYATRLRRTGTLDPEDYTFVTTPTDGTTTANGQIDLREFSQLQGRLQSEQLREWTSRDRYKELVQAIWKSDVGENPEQRPYLVDHLTQWLSGQDIYATDGNNLGSVTGVMANDLDHRVPPVTAMEHGILSYWICLRWPPVYEGSTNPLAGIDDWLPADWTGEPAVLSRMPPQEIKGRNYNLVSGGDEVKGLAPRGQHFRTGWNHVGTDIDVRDSFPYQANFTENWYHPDSDRAFVSTSLGHAVLNLRLNQISHSMIPMPFASIMAGT